VGKKDFNAISYLKLEPMDKGFSGAVRLRGVIVSFVLNSFFLVFIVDVIIFSDSIIDSLLRIAHVKNMNPINQTLTEKKDPSHAYHSGIKHLGNNSLNFLSNMASLIVMSFII